MLGLLPEVSHTSWVLVRTTWVTLAHLMWEREANKEGSVEQFEEFQPFSRRSGRGRRIPVGVPDTMTVVVKESTK